MRFQHYFQLVALFNSKKLNITMFLNTPPISTVHFLRFDTKNCTLHNGLMAMNGTCYFKEEVTEKQWHQLNVTFMRSKLPADEYFQ